MPKGGNKGVNNPKKGGKEERKARKAAANRDREKKKQRGRGTLDESQVASFAASLRASGFQLAKVSRDGNCFYHSLADQLADSEADHDEYTPLLVRRANQLLIAC